MELGKGLATVGIWIAVGVVGMQDAGASVMLGLFACLATLCIWQ